MDRFLKWGMIWGIKGYGDAGMWGYGDTGIWGYGDMGIRGYGDTRIRGYEDMRILYLVVLVHLFTCSLVHKFMFFSEFSTMLVRHAGALYLCEAMGDGRCTMSDVRWAMLEFGCNKTL